MRNTGTSTVVPSSKVWTREPKRVSSRIGSSATGRFGSRAAPRSTGIAVIVSRRRGR